MNCFALPLNLEYYGCLLEYSQVSLADTISTRPDTNGVSVPLAYACGFSSVAASPSCSAIFRTLSADEPSSSVATF